MGGQTSVSWLRSFLKKCAKKFKNSSEVWQRRILWLIKQKPEEIGNVMNRALLYLPQYEHIKFLSQVAILKFKSGVADRGRSFLEEMLLEYPKRIDLWSVYLNQEIRLGNAVLVRVLFKRATSLTLPGRRMKAQCNRSSIGLSWLALGFEAGSSTNLLGRRHGRRWLALGFEAGSSNNRLGRRHGRWRGRFSGSSFPSFVQILRLH